MTPLPTAPVANRPRLGRRARVGIMAAAVVLAIIGALAVAGVVGRQPPTSGHGAGAAADTLYRCPMHHDVTSRDPKARCPKCNMFINEPVPAVTTPLGPSSQPPAEGKGAAPPDGDERRQLIGVRRARIERRDLQAEVSAAAVVAPDEARIAHAHTKLSGWITRLFVTQTGEAVRRGRPLLAIYSEELYRAQQEYLTVRRSVAALPEDAGRAELIAAARKRLQLLDMPAGEIAAIEKSGVPRRDVVLPSPITGVVVSRNVTEGSYVEPGTDLFAVADLSRLWALVDVPVAQAEGIRAGAKAQVTFTALPGETREARVAYVYPSVAAETRTVRLRLELPNRDLKLKPGMFGQARMQVALPRALVVPAEAVLETGGERYVFVVKAGGGLEPRRIETGRRIGSELQVLKGATGGEEVVASASFIFDSESGLRAAIETMRRQERKAPASAPAPAPPASHVGHGH